MRSVAFGKLCGLGCFRDRLLLLGAEFRRDPSPACVCFCTCVPVNVHMRVCVYRHPPDNLQQIHPHVLPLRRAFQVTAEIAHRKGDVNPPTRPPASEHKPRKAPRSAAGPLEPGCSPGARVPQRVALTQRQCLNVRSRCPPAVRLSPGAFKVTPSLSPHWCSRHVACAPD